MYPTYIPCYENYKNKKKSLFICVRVTFFVIHFVLKIKGSTDPCL